MRAFAWFVGIILLAGLAGACLAYPAYELTRHVADWAFHRVASRLAMLLLAAELVWLCRHLRLRQKRDLGFGLPWRRFVRVAALWAAIGIATAAAAAAFLLETGLRVRDPLFAPTASGVARIFLVGAASGAGVSLLEETVFRGAMHTAIQREAGPWAAALYTAPLFAVLHFFAKVRIPADTVGWGSGFELLRMSFAPLGQPALVFDSFVAWWLVGSILSLTRALTGNIATAIGLHAGWVVVLRMLQQSTLGGNSPRYDFWVGRFDGLLGYWLLPWGVAIAAALWLSRAYWVGYARGASRSSR